MNGARTERGARGRGMIGARWARPWSNTPARARRRAPLRRCEG